MRQTRTLPFVEVAFAPGRAWLHWVALAPAVMASCSLATHNGECAGVAE